MQKFDTKTPCTLNYERKSSFRHLFSRCVLKENESLSMFNFKNKSNFTLFLSPSYRDFLVFKGSQQLSPSFDLFMWHLMKLRNTLGSNLILQMQSYTSAHHRRFIKHKRFLYEESQFKTLCYRRNHNEANQLGIVPWQRSIPVTQLPRQEFRASDTPVQLTRLLAVTTATFFLPRFLAPGRRQKASSGENQTGKRSNT